MGFLKKFFRNVFRESTPNHTSSSFEMLNEEDLASHLKISRYGEFELTDAVRPSYDLQVVPRRGYRHDIYKKGEEGVARRGSKGKKQRKDGVMDSAGG